VSPHGPAEGGEVRHPSPTPHAPPPDRPQPPVPPAATPAPVGPAPVPRDLDDRERSLDPAITTVWRLKATLWTLLPAAIAAVPAIVLLGRAGWLVVAVAVAAVPFTVGWYPRARYARWRWRLAPLALELRYGVIVQRHDALPYFRIQQIDVAHGPLDRLLGLASLQVTTASASGGAALPGLASDDAPTVRAELLARASEAVAANAGELSDAV